MVEKIRKNYSGQGLSFKARIAAIEANRDLRVRNAADQIRAEARPGMPVDEAVRQNTKAVSGNLYSMDAVRERYAKLSGGMKRSLSAIIGRKSLLIMKKSAADSIKWG
jgi:hypothetical protein